MVKRAATAVVFRGSISDFFGCFREIKYPIGTHARARARYYERETRRIEESSIFPRETGKRPIQRARCGRSRVYRRALSAPSVKLRTAAEG